MDSIPVLIDQAAARYGLDTAKFKALIYSESGGVQLDPRTVTIGGERHQVTGAGQILDTTAAQLGIDPTDTAQNIDGAARYLRGLLDQNGGDYTIAIQRYKGIANPDKPANVAIMDSFQGWVDRFKSETRKGAKDAESKGFGRSELGKRLGPGQTPTGSGGFIDRLKTPEFLTFLGLAVVLTIFALFNLTQTAKQAVNL